MPLKQGTSRKTISHNIEEMMNAGHPRNQSIAASLNEARESGARIPKPKTKEKTMKREEMKKEHKKEHKKEMPKKMMSKDGKDGMGKGKKMKKDCY